MRLYAASRSVADFDDRSGVGELPDRLVGHRVQQDVDLDVVVRAEAQPAALNGVLHGSRKRVD